MDRLFDSFSDNVDDRNNDDVSEQAGGETDTDSRSIFDRYLDVSDNESDGVNPEDELRTVLCWMMRCSWR